METIEYVKGALNFGGVVIGAVSGGLVGNTMAGIQIKQGKEQHEEAVRLEKMHHEMELKKAQELHDREIRVSKKLCIAERNTELKQHFQQLNADLISSNRESERDMYEQRNSQFQTIIVASTVMFGALCTVIIEGNIPQETTAIHQILIMSFSGASFAFLFVCMVLSLQIILRSSRFMYTRASVHNSMVLSLVKDTVRTLQRMDDDMANYDQLPTDQMWADHVARVDRYLKRRQDFNECLFGGFDENKKITSYMEPLKFRHQSPFSRSFAGGVEPAEMTAKEVMDSEPAPRLSRQNLRSIDSSMRSIATSEAAASLESFESFWSNHCKSYAWLTLRIFYFGTVCLLIAIALLMFAKLKYSYNNTAAGIVFCVFIFISIVGTLLVVCLVRSKLLENDHKKRDENDVIHVV